ncbi:hypothetical protein ACFOVU_10250 [Nocardiopsis sediminis]|uniref:DUF998 domain-containing protein n=1 Tax=Nocardiopsis sediminis TaxID=1778267 RepID=A0ABV8FMU4_9ACTN
MFAKTIKSSTVTGATVPGVPFPGRWVGGASLVLGPLLLLTGVLLRARYDFFFPAQLAAYQRDPVLMTVSYSAFSAGCVLLWPGVVTLAARIGVRCPETALWGGTLAVLGLSARAFHAGVDHSAFQLVRSLGVRSATDAVGEAYGAFHIFSMFNAAILGGWVLLAIGAYRSGVLGPLRALALASMSALPLGVLKGTTPMSVVAVAGLCVALVPLGLAVLREGAAPRPAAAAGRILLVAVAAVVMLLVGLAG